MPVAVSVPTSGEVDPQTAVARLKANGWLPARGPWKAPTLSHPNVQDDQQARDSLRNLGFDPGPFHIEDYPDKEWQEYGNRR
jgi:hypothetical protein